MKDINDIAQFSYGTQSVGKGSKSKLYDIAMEWWNLAIMSVEQLNNADLPTKHCYQDNVSAWWNVSSSITNPLQL